MLAESVKTPVGIEPTSTGLQPVAWPSSSSVCVRGEGRGTRGEQDDGNLFSRPSSLASRPSHIPAGIRTRIQTFGGSDAVPLHHQDEKEPTAGVAPASCRFTKPLP